MKPIVIFFVGVVAGGGLGTIYFTNGTNSFTPHSNVTQTLSSSTSVALAGTTSAPGSSPTSNTSKPPTSTVPPQQNPAPQPSTPDSLCQSLPRTPLPAKATIAPPFISFDFDDGFLSSYQNALPIINSAGFPTTQYIITGDMTKAGRVSADQVRAMQATGNEVGAHTRTHPFLTRIPIDQAKDEICGSRSDLIGIGITPKTFAYPEGNFNPEIEAIAKEAGFAGARITRGGLNIASTDIYALRSYQMSADTTFPQIKRVIDLAISNKEWLTIVFHRTDEANQKYSVSSQLIGQIVEYVKSTKVPVVTEYQGISNMRTIRGTVSDL